MSQQKILTTAQMSHALGLLAEYLGLPNAKEDQNPTWVISFDYMLAP